ncbi:MAG: nucleotidyltransferase domain-containing protein [Promethearchaeota archaeon]
MKNSLTIEKIKNDLAPCNQYEVVIYGSFLTEYFIPERSDVDVAIITRIKDKKKNVEIWKSFLGAFPNLYDIKIFELLPLYLKMEVVNNYKVIFGDEPEISEYFYLYRKIWKDVEPRYRQNQYKNIKEKIEAMEWLKNWKSKISKT